MQKIIDRVAKLLALAGNNANENEALAALEKAHALLAEHNLTMAEIGAVGQAGPSEDEVRDSLETDTNMPERYNRWIWNAVAKANACLCFSCRPNPKKYQTKYTLVGRKINTVVATQMALYLCQTMKRLASEHCRQAGRTDHAYKNAYLVGMAARLCERVADMQAKAAAAATGNALVLWSANEERENRAHVEEAMGIKLRSKKVAKVRYNTEAMGAGKSDAERVSLSQQVGGAKKAQQAIAAA